MELPAQLKANRERMGLSQEDVAKEIFVSRQTISNWETGKTYPDVQSLLLLSSLFGVSIDSLVKGDVATMKDIVNKDTSKAERLAWLAIFLFIIFTVVAGAVGYWRFSDKMEEIPALISGFLTGLIIFIIFLAIGLGAKFKVIRKVSNLNSYREILTYIKGSDPEEAQPTGALGFLYKHQVWVLIAITLGVSVACIGIGALMMYLIDLAG